MDRPSIHTIVHQVISVANYTPMILLILKAIFFILVGLVATAILTQTIGLLIPRKIHVVTTRSLFHRPEALSRLLQNPSDYPQWKPEVYSTTQEDERWKEQLGKKEFISYENTNSSDPDHIMVRTVGNRMPFKLERTYKIWKQDHMVFLQVEDVLHINKPYLRALGALFYDHKAFAKKEMLALETYLDQKYGSSF